MEELPKIQAVVDELMTHSATWSRFRGTLYVTFTLKATVALVHGKPVVVQRPETFRWLDKTRASGSIERPDEGAPFMGAAEVIVYGNLYAYDAIPGRPALGRVIVGVDRPLVDKTIGADVNGRIPLLWEEALLTSDNPVGATEPRLVNPRDPYRAIGLGPIAPLWQPRVQYLSAPINRHADILDLCDPLDPRFFNTAPADQQCAPFQGSEAIVLTSLVPNVVEFRTWLPALGVRARAGVDGTPLPLTFVLDTIAIDAETRRANLLWRAAAPLAKGARAIAFEAGLTGSFDRALAAIPPEEERPRAPVVQHVEPVAAPPPPPPPPPKKIRAALISVADPRAAVLDRIQRNLPIENLDLSKADLTGLDLRGQSFCFSKFEGATLARAKFDGADFEGADLSGAKAPRASFVGAKLEGTKLVGANLEGATFDDANVFEADFTRAILTEAKLRRLRGNHARFERATLVGADLTDASLDFANLEKTSVDDANFAGASLADASFAAAVGAGSGFPKARLTRANLAKARLTSATMNGADLVGANLEKADLSSARLEDACLEGAVASGVRLVQADLSRARMREAVLTGADLTGARLTGSDRTGAVLDGAVMKQVIA